MTDDAAELAADILRKRDTGEASLATLRVDDRVLARVTDGIYRRPSSAFRELISNAYDADATEVVIQTDAPRFERIVVRDNGRGMSPETLADLVSHIGGSSKRTVKGKRLETVNKDDSSLSVGGRRLIGKIGIGLFSVAQLTQHFQVITKRRGDAYRTSAVIKLKTYTEAMLSTATEDHVFKTGDVEITSEPASDIETQGTEVILMDLRPQAREILQSGERWTQLDDAQRPDYEGTDPPRPTFHIGRTSSTDTDIFLVQPVLPWDKSDKPAERFKKLYESVRQEVRTRKATPTVEESLDNYLGMLWVLSQAVPVSYIDKHPFDLTASDGIGFYSLTNSRGTELVELDPAETIGQRLGLVSSIDPLGGFSVNIDDVQLFRPVSFDRALHGNSEIGKPLMFYAKIESGLGSFPSDVGGGNLAFEAYFYWNQKIIPKDNNGCLVRINNSSGVLFDKSFLDYQISELTRLRQLMSEVFITEGLDSALNIDRESFNYSHPHYQYLQRWVHFAVRQATNRLKLLNKEILDKRRSLETERQITGLAAHVQRVWETRRGGEMPPEVRVVPSTQQHFSLSDRERGVVVMDEKVVLPRLAGRPNAVSATHVAALVQVLNAYGLLDDVAYSEQEKLIADITSIFSLGA